MIKTLRDAEIQIEALRDEIKRLKSDQSSQVTENWVKSAISKAIRSIKLPDFIQSNIFDRILIRSAPSGSNLPSLTIDSVTNDSKVRLEKQGANAGAVLSVNCSFDGTNYDQDDSTHTSTIISLRPNTANSTTRLFAVYRKDIGEGPTTGLDLMLNLDGDGMLYPGTDSTQDFGLTGTRWRLGYFDDISLTNPLSVEYGGTGRNTLTSGYTLQGNGTGQVTLVNGIDETVSAVISVTANTTTLNYKDHSGVNQTMDVVTSLTVSSNSMGFTKGVLTS